MTEFSHFAMTSQLNFPC